MTRHTLWAGAALLCLSAPAVAGLDRPRPFDRPGNLPTALVATFLSGGANPVPEAGVRMTADTVVTVDGRACAIADVPPTATITRLILAADGRTAVEIEFSTAK